VKRAIAAVVLVAFLCVAALAQNGETYWPTHGWRSSTPEAQGMDSEILARAFDYVRQHQVPIHSC
jgi:hypothetical protein